MPESTNGPVLVRPEQSVREAVLTAKVTVPALPRWLVPRERVRALIATGVSGPLTVVTGPPGSGKTVALASWAASLRPPERVAWVTLDQYDNRPEVFWSYLTQALRDGGVAIPAELPESAARQPDDFLHKLTLAIARHTPPATLVLDDFNALTEPRCLDGLAYVLRNASSSLRLVLSSRMDPTLSLHRYRLTGDLTEIRAEDLAFTVAEAGELMAHHQVTVPAESLKALTGRHEGWAAGLRLAAISMSGHPHPERFVTELDAEGGAIAGYLLDEVLNPLPPGVQEILLRTSRAARPPRQSRTYAARWNCRSRAVS